MKPVTLATTRLAEHWAHGLDITGPLGMPYRTPTGCGNGLAGAPDAAVRVVVAREGARDGVMIYRPGRSDAVADRPGDAESAISGPRPISARVAAQRLAPGDGADGHWPLRRRRAPPAAHLRGLMPGFRGRPGPAGPRPRDEGTGPSSHRGVSGGSPPPDQHCHTWAVSRVEGG